jgi:hypothetical protein
MRMSSNDKIHATVLEASAAGNGGVYLNLFFGIGDPFLLMTSRGVRLDASLQRYIKAEGLAYRSA